jgi:UDP-N-acetyl-D-galactosamine dehydrogenase
VPDLTPLIKSSQSIGRVLKKGDYVIYESTVYPGCTEEDCLPELEKASGLQEELISNMVIARKELYPGIKSKSFQTF